MKKLLQLAVWTVLMIATLSPLAEAGTVQKIRSEQFDLTANGRDYRIFTAVPQGAAPQGGFPVIYMTDGNRMLPIAAQHMQENGQLKAVLVGIGYPTEDRQEIIRLRYFDLTPKTAAEFIPVRDTVPETGGQADFFNFLNSTVKTEIEKRYRVNRDRQSLFGHSLGGLFTLYVLFNHGNAFQAYSAGDPSIWWNNQSILADRDQFLASAFTPTAPIPLLIETSGKRGERPNNQAAAPSRADELRKGPNGGDLFGELSKHPGFHAAFHRFDYESHGSMIPLNVRDSLDFLLTGSFNPNK